MILDLYGARTGNCLRVAVALEEAGLAYAVHRLDLAAGMQRAAEHLARNPRGKVPVLAVGAPAGARRMLTQSNAIQLWIDATVPGRLLPPAGAPRALALERWLFLVTDVIAPSHAGFALRRAGLDATAATHHDRAAMGALAEAEQFLGDGDFLAGESFSLADIAGLTIAAAYADALDWSRLPRLRRWFAAVGARAAVRRGLAAFD